MFDFFGGGQWHLTDGKCLYHNMFYLSLPMLVYTVVFIKILLFIFKIQNSFFWKIRIFDHIDSLLLYSHNGMGPPNPYPLPSVPYTTLPNPLHWSCSQLPFITVLVGLFFFMSSPLHLFMLLALWAFEFWQWFWEGGKNPQKLFPNHRLEAMTEKWESGDSCKKERILDQINKLSCLLAKRPRETKDTPQNIVNI